MVRKQQPMVSDARTMVYTEETIVSRCETMVSE